MSAPVSYVEVVLGYVGAAATKSMIIGTIDYSDYGELFSLTIEHRTSDS